MNKAIFYTIIILLLIFSCTEEVEIDLPDIEKEIVVNALIEPLTYPYPKQLSVQVTKTNSFLDTADYTYLQDALVYLKSGEKYDTLEYNDSLYRFFSWNYDDENELYNNVNKGDEYTLNVKYDGILVSGSDYTLMQGQMTWGIFFQILLSILTIQLKTIFMN